MATKKAPARKKNAPSAASLKGQASKLLSKKVGPAPVPAIIIGVLIVGYLIYKRGGLGLGGSSSDASGGGPFGDSGSADAGVGSAGGGGSGGGGGYGGGGTPGVSRKVVKKIYKGRVVIVRPGGKLVRKVTPPRKKAGTPSGVHFPRAGGGSRKVPTKGSSRKPQPRRVPVKAAAYSGPKGAR